jgi:hypothetical protein
MQCLARIIPEFPGAGQVEGIEFRTEFTEITPRDHRKLSLFFSSSLIREPPHPQPLSPKGARGELNLLPLPLGREVRWSHN